MTQNSHMCPNVSHTSQNAATNYTYNLLDAPGWKTVEWWWYFRQKNRFISSLQRPDQLLGTPRCLLTF